MNDLCVFCSILSARASGGRIYDRILYLSDLFVLIPALGSLVPGHVLVISRVHATSLASMGDAALAAYEHIVTMYYRRLHLQPTDVLQAEHGPGQSGRGGGCIEHVHVNLIPGLGDYIDALDLSLPIISRITLLRQLTELADKPYVFLRAGAELRVYDGTSASSQLVRRRLCERLGRDDWDWQLFPRHDNIRTTLSMWGATE